MPGEQKVIEKEYEGQLDEGAEITGHEGDVPDELKEGTEAYAYMGFQPQMPMGGSQPFCGGM